MRLLPGLELCASESSCERAQHPESLMLGLKLCVGPSSSSGSSGTVAMVAKPHPKHALVSSGSAVDWGRLHAAPESVTLALVDGASRMEAAVSHVRPRTSSLETVLSRFNPFVA